jgi:hypothetical protein
MTIVSLVINTAHCRGPKAVDRFYARISWTYTGALSVHPMRQYQVLISKPKVVCNTEFLTLW